MRLIGKVWQVPRIWEGGDAWILGGGPSIIENFNIPDTIVHNVRTRKLGIDAYSPYFAPIHSKHVIGVNVAYRIGNWMDMCFFGDKHFFVSHKNGLTGFNKLIVTCSKKVGERNLTWIKYLPIEKEHGRFRNGISRSPDRVCWNANSGAAAISLAAWTGAKRIILVGFDMTLDVSKREQHFHNEYREANKALHARSLPFKEHLVCWDAVKADADSMGIEILNVSLNSAIEAFPKVHIKEVLQDGELKPKFEISIVTPCSRPENLKSLYDSINFPCNWYIVFDKEQKEYAELLDNPDFDFLKQNWIHTFAVKGGVSGNLQRNLALDHIPSSFVHFLDDDNLMHPEFYTITKRILRQERNKKCIFYSQQLEEVGKVRNVTFKDIKVGKIDQAQFLIHTDLIGAQKYEQKYEADGIFINQIFEQSDKGLFTTFNDKPIVYYNKLCKK